MLSVAVVLLPARGKDFAINLRLTLARKSVYVSLGHKVAKENFRTHAVQNWIIKHPDAIYINREIEEKRRRAIAAVSAAEMQSRELTLPELVAIVKGAKGADIANLFFTAIEERWKYHFSNDQISDYYRFKRYHRYLQEAWGRDYAMEKITLELIQTYHLHRKASGVGSNTIRKELDDLGSIFSRKMPALPNPFKDHRRTVQAVPVSKPKLTKQDLAKIEAVALTGLLALAKDMFLFSFYAHGMRFENVALLEKETIKKAQINYQMNKGKKHRGIAFHPKLEAIIKKYSSGKGPMLFPIIKEIPANAWDKRSKVGSANAEINDALKVVAAAAGLSVNLTFHLARHSFAYNAMKNKVDVNIIRAAMGHSSVKTTEMYLGSFNDDEINEALQGLYS